MLITYFINIRSGEKIRIGDDGTGCEVQCFDLIILDLETLRILWFAGCDLHIFNSYEAAGAEFIPVSAVIIILIFLEFLAESKLKSLARLHLILLGQVLFLRFLNVKCHLLLCLHKHILVFLVLVSCQLVFNGKCLFHVALSIGFPNSS